MPAGAAADATLQEGQSRASGRTCVQEELLACPTAAGDARGWMGLAQLVTMAQELLRYRAALLSHSITEFLFFFSSRNKQSHVKSIIQWIPVMFITFF